MRQFLLSSALALSFAGTAHAVTVNCQKNIDDGRVLFSNPPELGYGRSWKLEAFHPNGQSKFNIWQLGQCDLTEVIGTQAAQPGPSVEQALGIARRLEQEQAASQAQQPERVRAYGGIVYVQRGMTPDTWISCEVLGATVHTQNRPRWGELAIAWGPGIVKPAPGWCVRDIHPNYPTVPVNPEWPVNLPAKLRGIVGFRCEITADQSMFWCDWPPYGQRK